jgi:general stress protein CsbA
MHPSISLLADKSLASALTVGDLTARAGLDVLVILVLVGWLYRRRRSVAEMPFALAALNLGLFAAMTAISAGKFPSGVGFGLFGILSLVRLRSAAFTVRDVAYAFIALVIALSNGLPQRETWMIIAIDVVLLIAVLVVDDPASYRPTRTMKVTLDRVYHDDADLRADLTARLGAAPLAVEVDEIDYVRETTRVSARYYVEEDTRAFIPGQRDGQDSSELPAAPADGGTSL